MSVLLPITNKIISYEFTASLDGTVYLLGFRYNYRAVTWLLDISDELSNPIYVGIPIRVKQDLLKQVRAYGVPQDILICFNNLSENQEPDRDTFSEEAVLLYNGV